MEVLQCRALMRSLQRRLQIAAEQHIQQEERLRAPAAPHGREAYACQHQGLARHRVPPNGRICAVTYVRQAPVLPHTVDHLAQAAEAIVIGCQNLQAQVADIALRIAAQHMPRHQAEDPATYRRQTKIVSADAVFQKVI